jgi:hypothetical protein
VFRKQKSILETSEHSSTLPEKKIIWRELSCTSLLGGKLFGGNFSKKHLAGKIQKNSRRKQFQKTIGGNILAKKHFGGIFFSL